MEKQKITVSVAGRNYTLVSTDPPAFVRRVAALADRRLSETAAATNLPSAQAAVLTCLNLAEDLLRAQDENTLLRRQLDRLSRAGREATRSQQPEAEALPDGSRKAEEQKTEG